MKNLLVFVFLLLLNTIAFSQPVEKTMKRLPDTGQTSSYTSTFGEDADYSVNTPVYIDNGDGTVTDTITGLMWQQRDGGEMTVEDAIIYCDTLTLGNYSDWRLPDCHELFSILNHDRANPALDTNYFSDTNAEYWWSSERQANDSNKVWATNAGGGVGNHPKSETISAGGTKRFHVRAVRDVTSPPFLSNHFTDNGDGTTKDELTGLIWQQIPFPDSITWEQALYSADTLNFAGHSDWRVPNIKELQSINDESRINPSVNQTFFSGVTVEHFWSSTSLPNQPTKAWYLDMHFGITTYSAKTGRLNLLCVRDSDLFTGLSESKDINNNYLLYSNSTVGNFRLVSKTKMNDILVYDAEGRVALHEKSESNEISFQMMNTGVFVLKIISAENIFTKKLIVIR